MLLFLFIFISIFSVSVGSTVPLGEGDAKILDVLNEIKIRGYKKNLILQAARINGVNDVKLVSKYKKFVEDAVGKKH